METLSFHTIAKQATKSGKVICILALFSIFIVVWVKCVDSSFVDNLVLLEQAIKDNNEKIRTYTPLVPIIGAGASARPSFLARLNSLDPTNPIYQGAQGMDISGSDSDWSVADNDSDTDVASGRV